ncbi:type IV pilin protein [Caldimonas sp. KR1-144]|uniref:type IV pilin protein n=1 Tax=Caldimonas sp. KR1-144 TaxID=3400911 RepID=UPI003C0CADC4
MSPSRHQRRVSRGFTLIELMIAVAIVAILASIALPSYAAYIQRSRVPVALVALSSYLVRMEQQYQNNGTYLKSGTTDQCAVDRPTVANFTVTCDVTNSGRSFTATATGTDQLTGYTYTIDQNGNRATTAHPKGAPSGSCWSIKGGVCDA